MYNIVEMSNNSRMTPRVLQFALLQKITDGFSEEHKLGSGGFGEVYKGTLDNGEVIAVKKLYHQAGSNAVQFKTEFENLMRAQHRNIVQLVGYCYEIHNEYVELQDGRTVFAEKEFRVICFEYLQGGSLNNYLHEEHCGLDWHTRYKIIKGICEGLNYLHSGLEGSILHMDLKPANILLDKNMVPKIADFGLSRFFGETYTHMTNSRIGTMKYMPPEFKNEGNISKKYDVFSLGVIIIEIVTGSEGYSKYCETSNSEQFIDLVYQHWKHRIDQDWKHRIERTPMHTSPEEDCKQMKRCIEIALQCVVSQRHKRPTAGDIINNLRETEPMIHNIELGASEFLTGVYGTTGTFANAPADVVTSLTLVTNARSYGPFGKGGGTHFQIPMWSNGSIVGFFGRAESYVNAIGVYANSEAMEQEAELTKIGPWGGNGGNAWDIDIGVESHRLESVTISYGAVIDSLSFSYTDFNGKEHTIGPWGSPGENDYTIRLEPLEFMQGVSGTVGPFGTLPNVITSLTFATNHGHGYGPFGRGGGTPFSAPADRDGRIVGFFGRAGSCLEAFGIYIRTR